MEIYLPRDRVKIGADEILEFLIPLTDQRLRQGDSGMIE